MNKRLSNSTILNELGNSNGRNIKQQKSFNPLNTSKNKDEKLQCFAPYTSLANKKALEWSKTADTRQATNENTISNNLMFIL
jgi:hypothetical protein